MFNLKRRVLLKAALHPGSRRLLWRGLEVRSPPACSPLEEAAPASASSWAAGNWPVTTTLQTFPLTCGTIPPTYSFFFFFLSRAHTQPPYERVLKVGDSRFTVALRAHVTLTPPALLSKRYNWGCVFAFYQLSLPTGVWTSKGKEVKCHSRFLSNLATLASIIVSI